MKTIINSVLVVLFALSVTPSIAKTEEKPPSPALVVHLLDYLAKDYGGAVKDGKVISASEFSEQVEFVEIVEKTTLKLPDLKKDKEFSSQVSGLVRLIRGKGSPDEVSALARKLQQEAIRLSKIEVAPKGWPNLSHGAQLYKNNCVSCHGASGHGDGLAGAGLDPKPANFHDPDLVLNSAPYKFFNTIRLGVPGTGMAAFSQLSDEEVWSLAFYLKSLPYEGQKLAEVPTTLNLKDIASLTDQELLTQLGGPTAENKAAIGSIRSGAPAKLQQDPLSIAESLLNESFEQAKVGNFNEANALSLQAYLQGFELAEPKIKANIPGLVEHVEGLMSKYRAALDKHETPAVIGSVRDEILSKINEAKAVFAEAKMSPKVAFGAAFSIFLREGFEAVLIIIVLISILRAMDQVTAIKWVHAGWLAAIGVGISTWFASGLLLALSGLSRELLEGGISLLAVVVLIYVGFWLHRYSEMKKWRTFLEEKLKHGLSKKNYLALAIVSFMAVFREAFEVVLFLRAIWIDLDPSGQTVAGMGVLSSFVLLLGLSYLAIKESRKLPLGLLFQICSWTMVVLAFILAGKGTHSLQEAGFLPVTTLPVHLRFDLIGIYPSFQTIAVQLVVVALFGFLFYSDARNKLIAKTTALTEG